MATVSETALATGHRRIATQGFRARFRPDIEGLRAIAVLTVLAFHASVPFFSGGFVGVDVFFVISGFLITGLLLVEMEETGRISLRDFFARRGRRILPSAAVVIVAIGFASWFIMPLLRARDVAIDMVSASLYVANWSFIRQGTDYLAASTDHSPLLHYWSLAVEEQFYFVWAPLMVLVVLVARRLSRSWVAAVGLTVTLMTLASLALSLLWTASNEPLAYLGSPTRAWQFGLGAGLAMLAPTILRASRRTEIRAGLTAAGWIGAAAIVFATVTFSEATAYPGTAALIPTLGAAAVILAGITVLTSRASLGTVLSTSPMRAIGRLSFAWYLWHWPVLIFGQAVLGEDIGWPTKTALVLISAFPAWLSMRLVERPIRFSRAISARASSGLAVGATATIVSLVAGLTLGTQSLSVLGSVALAADAPTLTGVFADGASSARNEGSVTPSPLNAKADRPKPDECLLQAKDVTGPDCRIGDPNGPTVVLFGDSHAQQWQPALAQIAVDRGWSLVSVTKSGCPVANIASRSDDALLSMPECAQWRQQSIDRISSVLKPSLIVVAQLHNYIPDQGEILTSWNDSLDQLRTLGIPIAYVRDTPWPGIDIPVCMSASMDDWSACAFPRDRAMATDPVQLQSLRGNEDQVTILDFTSYLCPDAMCPAARSGTLFYRDDSHITATLARVLAPAFAKALDDAGIAPTGRPEATDAVAS